MRTTLVSSVVAVCVAGLLAASAAGAPKVKHEICGQVKNGPYAAYTSPLGHHLKGRTWTVFANYGVPCSVAMKLSPTILKWWARAQAGTSFQTGGFLCTKDQDRAYSGAGSSSGGAGCVNGVVGRYRKNANFSLRMTGPYTIAQLKQLVGG